MGTPFAGHCCCPDYRFDWYSLTDSDASSGVDGRGYAMQRSSACVFRPTPLTPSAADAKPFTAGPAYSGSEARDHIYTYAKKRTSADGDIVFALTDGPSSGDKLRCYLVDADGVFTLRWESDWDGDGLGLKSSTYHSLYNPPILAVNESAESCARVIGSGREIRVADSGGSTLYTASVADAEHGVNGYATPLAFAEFDGVYISGHPIADDWPNFVAAYVDVDNFSWSGSPPTMSGDFTMKIVTGEVDLTDPYHALIGTSEEPYSWTTTGTFTRAWGFPLDLNGVLGLLWERLFDAAVSGDTNSNPLPRINYLRRTKEGTLTFTEVYDETGDIYRNYVTSGGTRTREAIASVADSWEELVPREGEEGVASADGAVRFGGTVWTPPGSGRNRLISASQHFMYFNGLSGDGSGYTGPEASPGSGWGPWRISYDQSIQEPLRWSTSGSYQPIDCVNIDQDSGLLDFVQDDGVIKYSSGAEYLRRRFVP